MTLHLSPSQRKEVVNLIISLSSSLSIAPGDLIPIHKAIESLRATIVGLQRDLTGLHLSLSDLSSDLSELTTAVGSNTANVATMGMKLQSMSEEFGELRTRVSSIEPQLTDVVNNCNILSKTVSRHGTDINNLMASSSRQAITIVDLQDRVAKLEAEGVSLTAKHPLRLLNGELSLATDPDFCSPLLQLSSYATPAQYGSGVWLVDAGKLGATSAYPMNYIAHVHGTRTEFVLSATNGFTATDPNIYLKFDVKRLVDNPFQSTGPFTPSTAFRFASFFVEITYVINSKQSSFLTSAKYTDQQIFELTVVDGTLTPPTNVFVRSIRYAIDT